jgi:FkbM family methyltransferase
MKSLFVKIVGLVVSRSFVPSKVRDLLMWPIATRVLGPNFKQVVEMKDGFKMYGSMGDILSREILFMGPHKKRLWEPETSRLLVELSQDSNNILIAGAHIGYLVLLSAINTSGTVHAFEPIKDLFDKARENIDLNPDLKGRIRLRNTALSDKSGELLMYSEDIRSSAIPYSGGHVEHQNKVVVPMTTIDEYVDKVGVNSLDLILLDVEGYEWFVLDGAKKTLESRPKMILELSPKILAHTKITPEMFTKRLEDMGYKLSYLDKDPDYANIYAER